MPSSPAAAGSVPETFVAGPLRLRPFRALMLAPGRVGDPASARALARPYREVTRRLRTWEDQGRVLRDSSPALHLHEYTTGAVTVRGLVGGLDLSRRTEDPRQRVVWAHEAIHATQAAELADRMEEMELQPAPILLVHRGDPSVRQVADEVASAAPDHAFTDRAGQHHRLWAVRHPGLLERLELGLADSRVLIADGHHRYAAYLRMQAERPGGSRDLGLAMIVDQDDTPLHLGAIHRVLTGTGFEEMAMAARGVGTVRESSRTAALAALSATTLVFTDGSRWGACEIMAGGRAGLGGEAVTAVEVLHERVVPDLPHPPRRIGYHHAVDAALTELAEAGRSGGGRAVAVLVPAPDFDAVRRTLAADRLLPEKATSFQPKPSLGVLMRSLLDG